MSVAGGTRFRAPRRSNQVSLFNEVGESVLHVGRPVKHRSIIEDASIDLSPRSGCHALDIAANFDGRGLILPVQCGARIWTKRRRRQPSSARASPRKRRSVCKIRIFGRGVGPEIGHILNLEVGVAGRTGFRAPGRSNLVSLFDEVGESILHVGRPMEPRAVIEDGAIDLSPWSRRHALDSASRLGRCLGGLRGVGRLRLDFGKDEKQQQTGCCRQSEQKKPAAQSSVERLHGESPLCKAAGMEPLIPD